MPAREFLAGHPLAPARCFHAPHDRPARVAAFDVLRRSPRGAPICRRRSRIAGERLDDDRDRALAAEIATGVARMARCARSSDRARSPNAPIDRLDPEIVDDPSPERVSAAPPDARSCRGRRGRRGGSGAAGEEAQRLRLRERRPPSGVAERNALAAAGAAGGPVRSRRRARLPRRPRCRIRAGLPRGGTTGSDSTRRTWMQFNNEPARLTLRANRLKTTPDALTDAARARRTSCVAPGRFAPDALIVEEGQPLKSARRAADGSFVVQDEASQLVALLAGPSPGPRVLDTCASPGGKTTAMAAAMSESRAARRVRRPRPRASRCCSGPSRASGATNVRIVQADVEQPLPFSRDVRLRAVDAPCSGLGTLRRDPDIRWRRREADLPALAAAQRRMLRHAADCVAPGGRLIYATCSSEPEENDDVVGAFSRARSRLRRSSMRGRSPECRRRSWTNAASLRTRPTCTGSSASSARCFERSSAA